MTLAECRKPSLRRSGPRPTSSTRSAPRSDAATARWRGCTPPTWAAHVLSALMAAAHRRRPRCGRRRRHGVLRHDRRRRPATSPVRPGWSPVCPTHVPGVTIDRQCGSSQQAVHFAAQGVMSGTQDLVVAGGAAEHVGDPDLLGHARRPAVRVLHALRGVAGLGRALRRPGGQPVPQRGDDRARSGTSRARTWRSSRSRATVERSARSTRVASSARSRPSAGGDFDTDEGPRRDTTLEKMAGLKPLLPRRPHHRRRRLADQRRRRPRC